MIPVHDHVVRLADEVSSALRLRLAPEAAGMERMYATGRQGSHRRARQIMVGVNGLDLKDTELDRAHSDYIVVQAEENGVNVIGLTRGKDTRLHHTEILDRGEVLIAQFTEQTSAIKIRGKARIFSRYGTVESEGRQGGHV